MDRIDPALIASVAMKEELSSRGYLPPGVSYDEMHDLTHVDNDAPDPRAELIDWLLMVGAGIFGVIFAGAAILGIVAVVQFIRADVETFAPTAAEAMAPGFDLEAKVAEVQP